VAPEETDGAGAALCPGALEDWAGGAEYDRRGLAPAVGFADPEPLLKATAARAIPPVTPTPAMRAASFADSSRGRLRLAAFGGAAPGT
jgi:hypothetical protein